MIANYDAVVIGAGNGGLTAAVRVLQGGKTCLVVEKHNLPGGFATSFVRGRFEFEASLHELCDFGDAEDPGDVRTLFRSLGVEDKIDWIKIKDAYCMITTDGRYNVSMPFGVQAFINKMEEFCPGSRPSMEAFFELCKDIKAAQDYANSVNGKTDTKLMKTKYANYTKAGSYSVLEVLKALKMPQAAVDNLSAYWCYLGVDCEKLTFLHYASMVYRYITKAAWMPKMKSHEISLALTERIRELGGDVWFNSEAAKINVDESGRICGVTLADGQQIQTHHVIANCSPHIVYGKLLDKQAVTEELVRATNSRRFSGRGITLFLGLNKSADELNIKHHNYFIYNTTDSAKQYEMMKHLKTNNVQATVCLNRADPDCSPKGTSIMYFTTMLMSDEFGEVKEEDYYKLKDKIADNMINVFEQSTGCKIRDSIEELALATPATYARYCGHPEGVIYGYEAHTWDGLTPRIMMIQQDYKTPGLRFAGGYSMRSSGYSSSYLSGDIVGRQTAGDIKREG